MRPRDADGSLLEETVLAMAHIRDFSEAQGHNPATRDVDADAPRPFRQELVDAIFEIAESLAEVDASRRSLPQHIHRVASQSLGIQPSGQPYGGFRYAVGRDIQNVEWVRVYDLISRAWSEFARAGYGDEYVAAVNRVLSGHGIAWELAHDGRLHRVMPAPAAAQVKAAIGYLEDPRFAAASRIFADALAFDAHPRRDRDACANAFDALESVAKVVFAMPTETFGQVLREVRPQGRINAQILGVLEALNTHRNRNFGHGVPFTLTAAEVDFTFLACVSGIILITRL
jgi:hypothetical protein